MSAAASSPGGARVTPILTDGMTGPSARSTGSATVFAVGIALLAYGTDPTPTPTIATAASLTLGTITLATAIVLDRRRPDSPWRTPTTEIVVAAFLEQGRRRVRAAVGRWHEVTHDWE